VWFGDLPEATQKAYLNSNRLSGSRYSADEAEEKFFDV
jgi:hypothetical protein